VEFAGVTVATVASTPGVLILFCESADRRARIPIGLDFANERLVFDPLQVAVDDDGTPQAVDHALARLRFLRGLVLNGRVEILDAANGQRLGRTDPNIPMNIDLEGTLKNIDERVARLMKMRMKRA
jgi:hypothetical protein